MSAPFPLFDFYLAKASINRGDDTYDDALIEQMQLEASAIVLDYCKIYDPDLQSPFQSPPDDPRWPIWRDSGAPFHVQAAARLVFGSLYAIREGHEAEILSDTVKNLLWRERDPAMA